MGIDSVEEKKKPTFVVGNMVDINGRVFKIKSMSRKELRLKLMSAPEIDAARLKERIGQ